jgi:hypothetical protein
MQEFSSWTLDRIRDEGTSMSWMEERKYDWIPLAANAIDRLINAKTFLLVTDRKREWFSRYILGSLNQYDGSRPLLPIVSLGTVFPHLDSLKDEQEMDVLEDMLSLTYPDGYTYFYIGLGNDPRSQIVKRKNDSFMWLLDEKSQNSFYLDSKNENLDIQLIQLIQLFNKSIDAVLCSEVDMQNAI